jgi:hypothetical protein
LKDGWQVASHPLSLLLPERVDQKRSSTGGGNFRLMDFSATPSRAFVVLEKKKGGASSIALSL